VTDLATSSRYLCSSLDRIVPHWQQHYRNRNALVAVRAYAADPDLERLLATTVSTSTGAEPGRTDRRG